MLKTEKPSMRYARALLVLVVMMVSFVLAGSVMGNGARHDAGARVDNGLNMTTESLGAQNNLFQRRQQSLSNAAADQFKTAPGDLPVFTVTRGDGETGEGYIFMAYFNYWQQTPGAYLLILEDSGEPVYYQQLAPIPIAMDFKKQPNGLLTYYPFAGANHFVALDDSYRAVRTYEAGNGYKMDFHDLQILENGNALLMIHDERTVDMSQIVEGGDPEATVIGCIIQEIDDAGRVVFEWDSLDHIPIEDSNRPLLDRNINYMNCNSLDLDHDGHILLSSRHLDEITKINRQTGSIIWRMGGRQNDFSFGTDPGFNYAHDARRLDNGHITVFDNGVAHLTPFSRGIEYEVDEISKTVSVVKEFRDDPDLFSRALGNMQRLPNGNTVIGWGRSIAIPVFTEFDASGDKVLEFHATPGHGSYRVFRFPWKGTPRWAPKLQVDEAEGHVRLYFSWNGSTETAAYRVYGGKNRKQLELLKVVKRDGFETSIEFDSLQQGLWYFQVAPVDDQGTQGPLSNPVPIGVGYESLFLPAVGVGDGS